MGGDDGRARLEVDDAVPFEQPRLPRGALPTDVAAGWALGAMWLTVIIVAARHAAAPPDVPANPDP